MEGRQIKVYQPQDLSRLVEFIFRIRNPEELTKFPAGIDLEELLDSPQIRELTMLWLDESSNLAGYVLIDPRFCNLVFEVEPGKNSAALQLELIDWRIDTYKHLKCQGKVDRSATLDTNCSESNDFRINALKSLGFIPQDLKTLRLSRSLAEPIPEVTLPNGFSIRAVMGEGEVDELVDLYHAAYGTTIMTHEDISSIMHTSSYDRELDLVVVAPDGHQVGLCTCSYEKDLNEKLPQKTGSTDPVLVHPNYQNLGLARAMIWSGWVKLKSRGIEVARLSTSSQNVKGIAGFTKAGYRVDSCYQWFYHPAN